MELIKNIKYSIDYKFTDSEYKIKKLLSDDDLIIFIKIMIKNI